MESTIPTLTTERLVLRPFSAEDAPAVQRLAAAPEVAATALNIPHPYPEGAAAAWIATHAATAAEGTLWTWAITRAAVAVFLGAITIGVAQRRARGHLGYWLGVPYWNHGYMTEAARCVVAFGFADLHLYRIEAACFPRNRASARVMEKAGLRYEGRLRGYVRKGETFEDVLLYALVRPYHDAGWVPRS
jgi:ribosomal-protein-alanine N-acetyltransferase